MDTNIKKQIENFKKENDAVLLAHYYVGPEIQEVADRVGDSFYLAQVGQELDNKVILMAGVYFMGETLKILNPEKRIFMLNAKADCPMAHMVSHDKIRELREKYDDLKVVCYVNSGAETKALSDVCVTSSNSEKICKNLDTENIFFIPDENLGRYIAEKIPEKNIILNKDGYCPIHNGIDKKELEALKEAHPKAKVLAHPECRKEILDLADYIGSTKGIIKEVANFNTDEFIIVTVKRMAYELEKTYPDKKFYYLNSLVCPDMEMPKVEDILTCMQSEENEIHVDEEVAKKALRPLQKMLELGSR
ncbi:MAG: quinolinate synthase NadA [Finegoldia sp.]|nr:quinolinate synthase NadA [Finegoldia sp.]